MTLSKAGRTAMIMAAVGLVSGCATAIDNRPSTPGWAFHHLAATAALNHGQHDGAFQALLARHGLATDYVLLGALTRADFAPGRAELDSSTRAGLAGWVDAQAPDALFIVEGFADPRGAPDVNEALAQRRAAYVAALLPPERVLAATGRGALHSDEAYAAQRRVSIWAVRAPITPR